VAKFSLLRWWIFATMGGWNNAKIADGPSANLKRQWFIVIRSYAPNAMPGLPFNPFPISPWF
jgi:hypothetical protein